VGHRGLNLGALPPLVVRCHEHCHSHRRRTRCTSQSNVNKRHTVEPRAPSTEHKCRCGVQLTRASGGRDSCPHHALVVAPSLPALGVCSVPAGNMWTRPHKTASPHAWVKGGRREVGWEGGGGRSARCPMDTCSGSECTQTSLPTLPSFSLPNPILYLGIPCALVKFME
jgi:hypothetical protein